MELRRLTCDHFVTDQLRAEDMAALAERGIRGVVNNRPDGEESDQASHAELEAAAHKAGLAYAYAPIKTKTVTEQELAENCAAFQSLPKPLCGFCRTGTRAAICWGLIQMGQRATYDIIDIVVGAGLPDEDLKLQLGTRSNESNEEE